MQPLKFLLPQSLFALTALAVSAPALADEDTVFTFEASAGVIGDSNVGAPDLEQTTDEGDLALQLRGKTQIDHKPTDKAVLRAGYEFSQTSHQNFDAFDLQIHRGFAEGEYDFGVAKAGILVNYAHARLDGEGYLDYAQVSPNVSRLFGEKIFLRAAYVRTEKDYKTEDSRDARGNAGRLDAFYFFNGTRQYMTLGGETGSEDAESDLFDLDHASAKGAYVQRFDLAGRDARLRLGAEIEQRAYEAVDPAIAEKRVDRILAAQSDLELPITGPVAMDLSYEYRDRSSNLDTADYDEHVASVELKLVF